MLNFRAVINVVKVSLKETLVWGVWKWLLGGVGAVFAILSFGKNFLGLDLLHSILLGIGLLLFIFIGRFLIFCWKNSLKYFHERNKNSIYGEAIIILKDTFAHAHAYRKTPGYRETEFIAAMLLFCDNLKIIYDSITKGNCSVSIKIPLEDNKVHEKAVLVNLTRDLKHSNRDTKQYEQTKHTLIGNTAFSYTLGRVLENNKEKYYVNNDVNGTKNYLNTSKSCSIDGKLEYQSELVHPIIPVIAHNDRNFDCVGFICIDCDKKDAFNNTKYEVAIIEGVADGLYDIISQVNQNKENGK